MALDEEALHETMQSINSPQRKQEAAPEPPLQEPEPAPEKTYSQEAETAFNIALDQRKLISQSIRMGSHPCMPDKDGFADTAPPVNIMTGKTYHGVNLLFLKDNQARNGYPSAEYITKESLQRSGVPLKPEEKGVSIAWEEKSNRLDDRGKPVWDKKSAVLYNVAQTESPQKVKDFAVNSREAHEQEFQAKMREKYGDSYQAPRQKDTRPGPLVTCSSTEPERYFAQYFAAVSMGSKFKIAPEQGAEFAKKYDTQVFQQNERGYTNPFALAKICNTASIQCKDVIRQAQGYEAPKREQTLSQSKSRGM